MISPLTTFERRQRLLALLEEQPGVRVTEMARQLAVSPGTVRNDLRALAQAHRLTRVRGGARLTPDPAPHSPAFDTRARLNQQVKERIARTAAQLVHDGDSILLDASSTVYHPARFLQGRQRLSIITNGLEVALALAQNPLHTVILLGGVLRADSGSVTGLLSEALLASLHVHTAFVSCSGLTLSAGLTEVDLHEAQLKARMIACADAVVALVDASKFGRQDLTSFAGLEKLAHLYTDAGLSPEWAEQLRARGIPFTICGGGRPGLSIQSRRGDSAPARPAARPAERRWIAAGCAATGTAHRRAYNSAGCGCGRGPAQVEEP